MEAYFIVSILFIFTDMIAAGTCFRDKSKAGSCVGIACVCAAAATLCYLFAVLVSTEPPYAWFSALHLTASDIMLLWLLNGVAHYVGLTNDKAMSRVLAVMQVLFAADILLCMTNPLHHFAMSYVPRDHALGFAMFDHILHLVYYVHLAVNYAVPVIIVGMIMSVSHKSPIIYRVQYVLVILGILTALVLNMTFLFLPDDSILSMLDFSKLSYSIAAIFIYYGMFRYTNRGMLNRFKTYSFENAKQGLVMFDLNGRQMLVNERARDLLPKAAFEDKIRIEQFVEICDIDPESVSGDEFSTRCFFDRKGESVACLCEMNVMRDKAGNLVARLFTFSDEAAEKDALTGFTSIDAFRESLRMDTLHLVYPMTVCALDLNGLMLINAREGRTEGDRRIQELTALMKSNFPPRTFFIRGEEAALYAICRHMQPENANKILEEIASGSASPVEYAVDECNEGDDLLTCMENATHSMRVKKLLNNHSGRSEMLNTLIKALQECDMDTEEHVQRTREMGIKLGERIGLTDMQISDLQLLCLLHDIGKIGVPLDILNKPGRLTESEWRALKQHTTKGYEIAMSSRDMEYIADMILHHHERWDGFGYPAGLKGENIPILSRVIAVVDAYDAMTNDRAYRKAMPVPAAIKELRRCAGTQFDPEIVEEFIAMLGREDAESEGETDPGVIKPASGDKLEISGEDSLFVHSVTYSRVTLDRDKNVVFADDRFLAMTGYSIEEVLQLNLMDLIPEEDREDYGRLTALQIKKNARAYMEHRVKCKNGEAVSVMCYGSDYFDSAERAERTDVVMVESGTTYAMRAAALRMPSPKGDIVDDSERDPLTGIPGWNSFTREIDSILESGRGRALVMLVDVDSFGAYVTQNGDKAGNDYLTLLAGTLSASLRREDLACRMGGDEFGAVLCFDVSTPNEVILERATQIFNRLQVIAASGRFTGVSAGIAVSHEGTSRDHLLAAAQEALQKSKDNGRGRMTAAD